MCTITKLARMRNERIMGDNESERILKESSRKEVEVVWACDAKRVALCRKEGDGNVDKREEKDMKA